MTGMGDEEVRMGDRNCWRNLASRQKGQDQSHGSHWLLGGVLLSVSSLAYFYNGRGFRRFASYRGKGSVEAKVVIALRGVTHWERPQERRGRDRVEGTGGVDETTRGTVPHQRWRWGENGEGHRGGRRLSRAGRAARGPVVTLPSMHLSTALFCDLLLLQSQGLEAS